MIPTPERHQGIDTKGVLASRPLTRDRLREEFELQTKKAPKDDVYIKSFSKAYRELFDDRAIVELIDLFLEVRQLKGPMLPWHAHNHLLRAYQAQLIRQEEELELSYPGDFKDPEVWKAYILRITDSHDVRFMTDLLVHSVQSNVSSRYRSMAMILDVLKDERYPMIDGIQHITALDVACSLNRGYKHLASDIPFTPILEARGADLESANTSMQNRLAFVDSLGVDLKALNDDAAKAWATSCSMYPSEREDQQLVKMYDYLDNFTAPGLSFEDADFVETGPEGKWDVNGRLHPSRIQRYGVVSLITFLYQLSPAERAIAMHHAKQVVRPDGLIIVQDFVDSPSTEWSYRTSALDMKQPQKGLQPLFVWNNGRCDKLSLPLDKADDSMELQSRVFAALAA